MTPEFILGFISGEGSFTTTCAVSDEARFGVYPSMQFKLNVKEKNVLNKIKDHVGIGRVVKETTKDGQWAWRVTKHGKLKELANWIENNLDCGFESSKKYQSFKKWHSLLDDRKKLIESKEGVKEFINRSREINSKSARTTGKTIEELENIVDSTTNYVCGVTSKYSNSCQNVVDNKEDTCYRHG